MRRARSSAGAPQRSGCPQELVVRRRVFFRRCLFAAAHVNKLQFVALTHGQHNVVYIECARKFVRRSVYYYRRQSVAFGQTEFVRRRTAFNRGHVYFFGYASDAGRTSSTLPRKCKVSPAKGSLKSRVTIPPCLSTTKAS